MKIKPIKILKYYVVASEKIETKEEIVSEIPEGCLLLKPLLVGICQSDLRYFFGRRDPEVLKKKYPLCLLHEGIAEVVETCKEFKKGEKVVVIPNIPCYVHDKRKCRSCSNGEPENYCENVKFMSSSCDGMSQTSFLQPIECVAKIPEGVPDDIAVLTELITVVYRAAVAASVNETDKVIVFGCGPTGYIMAALLRFVKGVNKENLYVTDINDNRLEQVREFASTVNANSKKVSAVSFDKAFDCVGGKASESSINKAIGLLKPKGNLVLLGVSETKIAIQTRAIVDKGLTITGTTRSPRQDFPIVLDFLRNKELQHALSVIICNDRFKADSVSSIIKAFKKADDPKHYGKVLIEWV